MSMGTHVYLWRRKLVGVLRRALARLRHPSIVKISDCSGSAANEGTIIWSTQIVANRSEELENVYRTLELLRPVLAWASLTVDGTSTELDSFISDQYRGGFQNLIWLTKPEVIRGRRYSKLPRQGYYRRITLNYLRGWLSNMAPGEDCPDHLFCHTDGDWEISIRRESIEPLHRFFREHPQVAAISRNIDRFLMDEPNMWADQESAGELWFGNGIVSTNLVISPMDRFQPLLLEAWKIFFCNREFLLEDILRRVVSKNKMVTAYPSLKYFRDNFFMDLAEKRKPF